MNNQKYINPFTEQDKIEKDVRYLVVSLEDEAHPSVMGHFSGSDYFNGHLLDSNFMDMLKKRKAHLQKIGNTES